MLVIAALLLGAAVVVGFYAHQNPGSHDVNMFGYTWTGVYDWVPVAIAAGVVGLICVAAMIYAGMRINMLRRANAQLRTENDLLRAVPVTTPAAVTPTGRLVSHQDATGQRNAWYDRGRGRFGWFGRGSKQERQAARRHEMVQPTGQPAGQPTGQLMGRPTTAPPAQTATTERPAQAAPSEPADRTPASTEQREQNREVTAAPSS